MSSPSPGQSGLVIARYNKFYAVEDENGEITQCVSRKKLSPLCGDRVIWEPSGDGGVVTAIMPRHNVLTRPNRHGQPKESAANIDQLIIVNAVPNVAESETSYEFNSALTDRYIVASVLLEATPLIVINKCDLASPELIKKIEQALQVYREIGYATLVTSTTLPHGISALTDELRDRTSIFVGESGVGKSSLINAIMPALAIRTDKVSAHSGLGKHTTTTSILYHLPQGGNLIDSPGVREFGLWQVGRSQLAQGFRDFLPYLGNCKFRNCNHHHNAGCAVEAATSQGKISAVRMRSYYEIYDTLDED